MNIKFSIILALMLVITSESYAEPIGPLAMQALYHRVKSKIENPTTDHSFYLQAKHNQRIASGEAAFIFPQNFDEIANALSSITNWCEILILHINVKACVYNIARNTIQIYLGRKYYQIPQNTFRLNYGLRTIRSNNYFAAIATARKGPLGTSNNRIVFELMAINGRSFVRIHASDQQSWRSSKAINVYLATKGAKQGIKITGCDQHGSPIYSKGKVAIAERNLLRYYFAFAAFFAHIAESDMHKRHEAQMEYWFKQTEKFPQLYEISKPKYLNQKHQERINQATLQQIE